MAHSMNRAMFTALVTLLPATLVAQSTPNAPKPLTDSYVIRNATVVPVVGPRIDKGTVVIVGGKITAVTPSVGSVIGYTFL